MMTLPWTSLRLKKGNLLTHTEAVFTIVLFCIIAVVILLRGFDLSGYVSSSHLMDDDLRQHLISFYAHQAPEQFQDGFLAQYSAAYLPWGYKVLFLCSSILIDPMVFSKILGVLLLSLTLFLAYRVGREIGGRTGGLGMLLLALNCHFLLVQSFSGLFRSFAFPLILAFLLAWYRKNLWAVAATVIALALFYPPLAVVVWTAYSFACILPFFKSIRSNVIPLALWTVTSLCMVCILLAMVSKPDSVGPVVNMEMARMMPEWSVNGRFRDIPFPSTGQAILNSVKMALVHPGTASLKALSSSAREILVLVLFCSLLPLALRNRKTVYPGIALAISGMGWYLLARNSAFSFGYPDRYLDYSIIPAVLTLWPAAWMGVHHSSRIKYCSLFAAAILLLTTLLFPPDTTLFSRSAYDSTRYVKLLDYLRDKNEPMLIAGWPRGAVEYIPVVAHKEVLIDYEHAHPLYLNYYDEVRNRLMDVVKLTYATNITEAIAIRDRYGLTHLLVENTNFDLSKGSPHIFDPYNALVLAYRRGPPPGSHIFSDLSPAWVEYEDDIHTLIDITALSSNAETAVHKDANALAEWHRTIELISFDVGTIQDSTVPATYKWQVSPVENHLRFAVFLHFEHESSDYMFCGDHRFLETFTREEVLMQDPHTVFAIELNHQIPDDAPSGKYRIQLGLIGGKSRREDRLIRSDLDNLDQTVWEAPVKITIP